MWAKYVYIVNVYVNVQVNVWELPYRTLEMRDNMLYAVYYLHVHVHVHVVANFMKTQSQLNLLIVYVYHDSTSWNGPLCIK